MVLARRSVFRGMLVAGGLAAAAALYFGGNAREDLVTEYKGADDPAALQNVIAGKSQDRYALIMFHESWCPYCKALTGQLRDAAPLTSTPYSVVKVDVTNYSELAKS